MLDNLTDHENRIYDKLLVEMGRKEPYEEVRRLSILFRQHTDIEKNSFLFEKFKTFIDNKLYFHLKSKEEFYDLNRFKDIYKTLVEEFIEDNIDEEDRTKFSQLEYEKFKRVRDYFANEQYPEDRIRKGRIDFYKWFKEIDIRRDTNLLETFPEMEEFMTLCKETAQGEIPLENIG